MDTDMGGDRITRRLWQEDWRDKAVRKAQEGGKLLVGNIAPGSGKTLGTLDVANEFFRHRMIDCVAVFVPRINLCTQYELDWAAISSKFCPPVMGRVDFRKNNPPLIRDNFGYVTTYASLIAAVEFHIQQLKGKRFMMIIDEAQMLGCDTDEPGLGTQSGIAIERLAALPNCVFVQLVSGTPYRADGQRLVLAQYDGPDADGKSYLKADVTVSYLEGVSMGYLRPFEAILHDGAALREYLDGEKEHLYLSKMDKGVSAILMDERFWAPMVDATIQKVLECQMVHLDFCGLIGACNQDHAKRIQKYISNHSAGVKSLIAVSSEDAAQDNLRDFKKGGYDILITVAMAHVGYDHKPITVVCCLNAFREKGWLDQFAARGLRVFSDVLLHLQMLYFICPDDKKMRSWVESMRVQSDQGIRERAARKENDDAKEKESEQARLSVLAEVRHTGKSAKGMDPTADLVASEFSIVDDINARFKIGATSITGLGQMMREHGMLKTPTSFMRTIPEPEPVSGDKPSKITRLEWEKERRRQITQMAKRADGRLKALNVTFDDRGREWQWGDTGRIIMHRFGELSAMDMDKLDTVLKWLESEWIPETEKARSRYAHA